MDNDKIVPEIEKDETFPFTNYTDHDFTAYWDGVGYTFPANKTVKMLGMIPTATPLDIQAIRRKFATDLATAIFYQSDKFKAMDLSVADSQAGKVPALYTDKDLAPFIQRCLEPLSVAKADVTPAKPPVIETRKDDKGKPVTKVLDGSESLVGDGQVVG